MQNMYLSELTLCFNICIDYFVAKCKSHDNDDDDDDGDDDDDDDVNPTT